MNCLDRNLRTASRSAVSILIGALVLGIAGPASALYLEARLFNPANSATEALDSTSVDGPVDIAGQVVVSSGTITYQDSTDQGEIQIDANHLKATNSCAVNVTRRHITTMQFSDLVVTCPDSSQVNARLNLNFDGYAAFTGPNHIGMVQLDVTVRLGSNSVFVGRWIPRSSFTTDVSSGIFAGVASDTLSGIYTTPAFRVPVGQPIAFHVTVAADVGAGGCNRPGGDRTLLVFSKNGRRIGLPIAGPVFQLPAGGNANSPQGHVVDNVWARNRAPVCNAGGPYAGIVNEVITLDGSASADADGQIVAYAWNFGDGSIGSGATTQHAYGASGNYWVALCVTDNDGATTCCQTMVAISEPPNVEPGCDAGGPYAAIVGDSVAFDGTGSSDSDGQIVAYEWTFGDGSAGSGATVTHAYAAPGDYDVALCVTDDDGARVCCQTTVTVSEPPNAEALCQAGGPYAGIVGDSVAFDGTGSSDSDGQIVAYEWKFGDGSTGSGATVRHSYAAPGDYSVELCVTDDDGATVCCQTVARIAARPSADLVFDIRPASCPNPFNPKSRGVLPAALLGSASCPVPEIDPASIRLLGTLAPVGWAIVDVGTPNAGEVECACSASGADGLADLTLNFDTQAIVRAIGRPLWRGERVSIHVSGALRDGTPFDAADCVLIVQDGGTGVFGKLELMGSDPNPFQKFTQIRFSLSVPADVRVMLYDTSGRLVRRLLDGPAPSGDHAVYLDAGDLPSGVYFYRVEVDGAGETRKVILAR